MSITAQGIFEVHLGVSDRLRSAEFYQRVLGFKLATHVENRDITFLWIGEAGSSMLGLWGPGCPNPPVSRVLSHFAVRLPEQEVIAATKTLRERGVEPLDFDGNPTDEAIVLAWMPAVSVYFRDPDGHSLEFISMLSDVPDPAGGIFTIGEWEKRRRFGN